MIKKPINISAGIYYRRIQSYMKKAFKKMGLSFEEGLILQNVYFNSGTTQDAVARSLAFDTAAVARGLKRLEAAGYVSRIIDPDNQRRKIVTLTDKGNRTAGDIISAMDAWDNAVFAGMDDKEIQEILSALSLVQQKAEAVDINALLH